MPSRALESSSLRGVECLGRAAVGKQEVVVRRLIGRKQIFIASVRGATARCDSRLESIARNAQDENCRGRWMKLSIKSFVYFDQDDAVGSVVMAHPGVGGLVRGVMRCYVPQLHLSVDGEGYDAVRHDILGC
jgi:hypothetical protein